MKLQYRFDSPVWGPWEGEVEAGPEPLQVGRAPGGLAPPWAQRVSRRHAAVTFEDGCCWIEDLGSRAGILIGLRDGSRKFVSVRSAKLNSSNYANCGGLVVALIEGAPLPRGSSRAIVRRADGGALRGERLEILQLSPTFAEDGRAASVPLEGFSVAGLSKALGSEFTVEEDVHHIHL